MIQLRVLGTLDLRDSQGRDVGSVLRQPKLLALLLYLAVARPQGFYRRDTLVALLWPDLDHPHARNALRQAVHALRKALGPDVLVARGDDDLAIDERHLWCDAREFAAALEAREPERALELYRGDLANGLHVSAVPEFERWIESERDHLRRRALEAVRDLAAREDAAGNAVGATRWGHRWVTLAPHDEMAVRDSIRRLDALGDRAGAIRVFEEFERRLARDLDLEPSSETRALVKHIRAVPGQPGPEPGTPGVPPPDGGSEIEGGGRSGARTLTGGDGTAAVSERSGRLRLRRQVVVGTGIVAAAGSVLLFTARTPARIDAGLFAVAPLDVRDPALERLRGEMVAGVSRGLDGAGSLRIVAPSTVVRAWRGSTGGASARRLARRTGAGVVLYGRLERTAPESVRVSATVLDIARDADHVIDRTVAMEDGGSLTDSVVLDILRALAADNPGLHRRLASPGTASLPALKAFLRGEYHLRRFALDSAIASYDLALALDTTFALAFRGAARAREWSLQPAEYHRARAARFNHGLDPRDSLLITAESPDLNGTNWRVVAKRTDLLRKARRQDSEDPDAWFTLGVTRSTLSAAGTWDEARDAFDRAIALDSSFAPAYVAAVQIALRDDDREAARRYVRGYLAVPDVDRDGAGMGMLGMLLESERGAPRAFHRALEAAAPSALARLALMTRAWPDEDETQVVVARHLFGAAQTGRAGVPADRHLPIMLLSDALLFRGHLREARDLVGNDPAIPAFMELARLGAIPAESVDRTLGLWIRRPMGHLCERTMDAAMWWAARRDTANLQYLVNREDSLVRVAERISWLRPVPRFARAALALARGDTASALHGMVFLGLDQTEWWSLADTLCPSGARPRRETQFLLLAAAERYADAAWAFDHLHVRRVPLLFERASLAERQGDRLTAVKYYRLVSQAWARADPELQPVVNKARDALRRLGEGDRRGR